MKTKFKEFLELCRTNPEKTLVDAAKSVVGNHCKDSIFQTTWDKEHAHWAGEHGLYNLAIAIEAFTSAKKGKRK